MESQSPSHQTSKIPPTPKDIDTDILPSPGNPLETKLEQHKEGNLKKDDEIINRNVPPAQPYVGFVETALEMVRDSQKGKHGAVNFTKQQPPSSSNADPGSSSSQQQLPPSRNAHLESSASDSSEIESAKAMNADFFRCLRAGQIDVLKRMLEDEEDSLLDQVTPQQNTALHIVARQGFDQLIEPILTRHPALVDQKNINGDTALHLAARAGHLAAVEYIMEFVGKIDLGHLCEMRNRDVETALHVAVRHKHIRVAMFLIKSHPKASFCLNGREESPLCVAAELGELELVRAMIQASDMDDAESVLNEGKSVVHSAILGGNPEGSISPLSCAAWKGNVKMVRYILTQFPDCTYKRDRSGLFPIHMSALGGHKMALDEFLRLHPDSGELLALNGYNILHLAAVRGNYDVVSYILSKPYLDELINARTENGYTPLFIAVSEKYPKVVDALTWDKRVRLDLVNNDGLTALDLALTFRNSMTSLKEQLAWVALNYAGAPRRHIQQYTRSDESEKAAIETCKNRARTLSVVATLVTTMSFAAGITIPGGNSGSYPDLGMANFYKRRIFELFVLSNSIALYTSVLDVLVLIFAMLGDAKMLKVSLDVGIHLLATSLATMSVSFMSAAYLAVSSLKWLGIVIWVLGSLYLAALLALFFLLFPSSSAKNRFTRYLVYPPFWVMLYISDRA